MHKNECAIGVVDSRYQVLRGKRVRSCVKRDMKAMGIKELELASGTVVCSILLGTDPC